ncbi:MAG: betI 1 [Jatrophihabitans sp.]|nr:betI 1 [Jatrophihabitans sp.]
MRGRLLDATIDCLAASGYGGLSTNDVVRRAGVSRGALAHHFPSKTDLVVAAGQRLIDERAAEFRQRFAAIPQGERTIQQALDVLWSFFESSTFAAIVELDVAARTHRELRRSLAGTGEQIAELTRSVFLECFPDYADRPFLDEVLSAVVALFSGLALQNMVDDDPLGRRRAVRGLVGALLSLPVTDLPLGSLAR